MRPLRPIFALLLLLAAGFPAAAQLSAPAGQPQDAKAGFDAQHLRVELLVPGKELYSGAPIQETVNQDTANEAGLYFKLEPGWHVYWLNAGSAGLPPEIHWTLPKGISATPLEFPAPARLPLGPLMDYGYENQVLFPFHFQVAKNVKPGPAVLNAKVDWLVCSSVCIPGKAELELTRDVAPGPGPAAAEPALFAQFIGDLPKPLPAGDTAVFEPTPTGFRLAVETGEREKHAEFFPSDPTVINDPSPQKLSPTAKGLVLGLTKDPNLRANPARLNGVLELSGGRNYRIAAAPGTVAAPPAAPSFSLLRLMQIAGLAFLGGLLLNLMPCVFPVLFLKGLALVQSGSEERHKLRTHGFVYAAGIVVSFWVLVAVLLVLRAAGGSLGWGFQFQSPVFLALMTGLLFFLGLSLAGQFDIGLTLTSAGGSLAAKQGYAGSFFTGVLAVVVATPCAAPFMGVAVGYALAQPAAVTFAVFTALALGLAAPYVALTLQPAWTRILPRPGAWMEVLKQAVSVPIFGTAIWLAWVLASAYGANLLGALLVGLLLLAVAGWFLGRWPAKRWATGVAVLFMLGAIAICVLAPGKLAITASASSPVAGQKQWQPWSQPAVNSALAAGQPVFVDFTASWCLSCQYNERVALDQPEVMQAFQSRNVVLMRADWTREDENITQVLAALGRSGVPAYALYTPGESNPQLLPQVLTPGIVIDTVDKLPRPATEAGAGSSN